MPDAELAAVGGVGSVAASVSASVVSKAVGGVSVGGVGSVAASVNMQYFNSSPGTNI